MKYLTGVGGDDNCLSNYLFLRWCVLCMYFSSRSFSVPDAPRISLTLGSSLDRARIKEGDDVYFECSISANPPVYKRQWRHNVSQQNSPVMRLARWHGVFYGLAISLLKRVQGSAQADRCRQIHRCPSNLQLF